MTTPLSLDSLPRLVADGKGPAYRLTNQLRAGIVHLSPGGFHRSHLAHYLDELFHQGRSTDWALTEVSTMPASKALTEVLQRQDGLYTLVIKEGEESQLQVVGSILGAIHAPDDYAAALAALCAPETRIVSLTITEGGYNLGLLDQTVPLRGPAEAGEVPADEPICAFRLLVTALHLRHQAGIAPFTVLSCDNVPGNGKVARANVLAAAEILAPELVEWISTEVSFPNSMVDRITPVTTEAELALVASELGVVDEWPVRCEPFCQWILEDDFPTGRPRWESVGVQIVRDVTPYELMKLRLLNGAHQAAGHLGALAGFTYCHEVFQDEDFGAFVAGYQHLEARPTVPATPGINLNGYITQLHERFSNEAIADTNARLREYASDRFPKFVLPVLRANLETGGPIARTMLVIAGWAATLVSTDVNGAPIDINDPAAKRLRAALMSTAGPVAFLEDTDVFGDLGENQRVRAAFQQAWEALDSSNIRSVVQAWS